MAMKVEKQSRKFIKPFVPTSETHHHYRIGLMDEFAPPLSASIILFFQQDNHNPDFVGELEKSLEKTLTRFYPLAGRYVQEIKTVECNDEGVEFIHAKVNIKLQDFLDSEVNINLVDEFIPFKTRHTDLFTNPLLTIQVTTFNSGGVAVGVRASHRIVDASTLCTFLNEWATVNREESHETEFTAGPVFNSSLLFPSCGLRSMPSTTVSDDMLNKYIRKKLRFSENEISNIRTKATASGKYSYCKWSKVQLVSAIIWKALCGVDLAINNSPREYVLVQPVSLREKMASLIPKNSCGNLWGFCYTKAGNLETIEELADLLTSSVKKMLNDLSEVSHDSEEGQKLVLNSLLDMGNFNESTNMFTVSSWCKFPFYEIDFGYGKPIWATPGTIPIKNTAFLMDDVGGNGVEAYVFLAKQDVSHFEEALDSNVFGA